MTMIHDIALIVANKNKGELGVATNVALNMNKQLDQMTWFFKRKQKLPTQNQPTPNQYQGITFELWINENSLGG